MGNIKAGEESKPTLFESIKAVLVGENHKKTAIKEVQGHSYLKGGTPLEGKKLSERGVADPGLDQAFVTIQEHGIIREAQDKETLDELEKRYNSDKGLDPANRAALLKAVKARLIELMH
ncbi:hypothetical protein [Sansalvadorimonas verongulae]|uniref:hypothetical protein n=1 Tax=Sansalvadorimonas verongulae TaxID=2172824 RepID=UPI0012BB64B0|nr:hypothetical protein [Sansalvadorimonas verongulae]MTI14408.1 hypothetical protein [Sansalvadorimonas verongulae]